MNFTNEGGVAGTFTFLKNIMGLWLLQQCRRAWAAEREYTYAELAEMAETAEPFRSIIDPDRGAFLNPPDMPAAIAQFCTESGQPAPDSKAACVRCILESLALRYRLTLDQLRVIDGRPIERIHVIGGGSRNELLCRLTADATGLPVIAGPAEATAIGNIMVQALATGRVASLAEMRRVIARSFELTHYEPRPEAGWDAAFARFRAMAR
jgi:rhamnulokinase